MSQCPDCLYYSGCDKFHMGSRVCGWYAPVDEDHASASDGTEYDRDKYYREYVKYVSEFDEDFIYE